MKRCLIADKSEIIRTVARHYLEQAQVEVLEADSADAALALIRDKGTDAVILDWRLPGKTTIEILSALRFGDKAKRPLVIYATTENDPADLSRAFAAGANSYLMKPFDQSSFMESMANAGVAA
ncbi:chemotaxis protein CheY [Hyphomicrobium nitrativorans NL23]|uniref:Chemotaxis protein CheY n=1 Tax=Hyphomicrobium nitrativorans NL23 TaxID=1029756 RepID=V5SG75_9HYPH|nr:response regulator [Hyphomicrobium nitrativorans]AHB49502.1 chemotaxis protein CheY [Hyphomicrobium nitrativorans NL23]